MKKVIIISAAVLCAVVTLVLCWFCLTTQVRLDEGETATLSYKVNGKDIQETLSHEEALLVAEILTGKIPLWDGGASCGFDPGVSIAIDGKAYCLAWDSCGFMQIDDTDWHITLTEKERAQIEEIFAAYGGTFPCV